MGEIMSHGSFELPGGRLDEIDPGGAVGMEIDKAGRQRKPIEAQPPAPASPRLLYGLGADGGNPAAVDEHRRPAEILSAAEHTGSAQEQGFLFWCGFTSSHDWRKITEYRGPLPSAFLMLRTLAVPGTFEESIGRPRP